MKKTPSVFLRNPENMSELTHEINPEAKWVLYGEGVATRKYDGTCVMLDKEGIWWARREVKKGKSDPNGFMFIGEDEITGKRMGWVPMTPHGYGHPLLEALGASDIAKDLAHNHFEDVMKAQSAGMATGTYELCGPKIGGNWEGFDKHVLIRHATAEAITEPACVARSFEGIYEHYKSLLTVVVKELGWEGLVWHHPDGRLAKLKVRDFK